MENLTQIRYTNKINRIIMIRNKQQIHKTTLS